MELHKCIDKRYMYAAALCASLLFIYATSGFTFGKHRQIVDATDAAQNERTYPGGATVEAGIKNVESRPKKVRKQATRIDRYDKCAASVQPWNTSDSPLLPTKDQLTRFAKARRLFYSMVIKTGSGTTIAVTSHLSRVNHFKSATGTNPAILKISGRFFIDTTVTMNRVIAYLLGVPEPVVYMSHTPYIDFGGRTSKGGRPVDVVYMNIVRDPFERLVSFYYASRTLEGHRNLKFDKERISMSYDTCVSRNHTDCMSDALYSQMTSYFCGHGNVCRTPSKEAFDLAKLHIQKDFAVVGMLENYEPFLTALEDVLPQFYRGALSTFKREKAKPKERVHSNPHQKPSAWTRDIIRDKLYYEYKLYDYIKMRFEALEKLLKCMQS